MTKLKAYSFQKFLRVGALLFIFAFPVIVLLSLWSLVQADQPKTKMDMLCVKPGGGDGCLASISDALALAQEADTIRVAGGNYNENLTISRTVYLEGGWNSDFSVRDIDNFTTTITPADNTFSVVHVQGAFGNPEAVAPLIEGFEITGGRADLGSNHGGGMSIIDSNALVISNTIHHNAAFLLGGGVWVQRGGPMLQGNRIMHNQSVGNGQEAYGGGVQLENSAATLMVNQLGHNVVSGTESFGGALSIIGEGSAAVRLTGNHFFSNTAGLLSAGGFGGAISVMNGQSDSQGNLLSDNLASENGGAIYLSGLTQNCCQISSTLDSLQANHAANGGALFNDSQLFMMNDGLTISNTASTNGGAFYIVSGGSISFTNSAAVANTAANDGGAIYNSGIFTISNSTMSGNSALGMGGALANFDTVNLFNSTVSDNESPNGAGLMNASLVMVQNSLIAENIGSNCSGGLFSLGNNLEDGFTCAMGQPSDQNNIAPEIGILMNNGGGTLTHALEGSSPAIDAGDNAACAERDQRGVARPVDGDGDGTAVCDIGAFEYVPSEPTLYMPVIIK